MKPLLVDIADPDDRGNHFLEREGGRWVPITKAERDLIAAAREALVLQPRNKAQAGQLGVYG